MKPVFFELLCQVIVVPTVTQKGAFPFASAILGVAEAEVPVRLTFTTHGTELDPHFGVELQTEEQGGFSSFFSWLRAAT